MRREYEVSVERRRQPGVPPVDVLFGTPVGLVAAEAKAILLDDLTRAGIAFSDTISDRLNQVRDGYDVEFDGQITVKLTGSELEMWHAQLAAAAAQVAADDQVRVVQHAAGTISVIPGRKADGAVFKGPLESGGGWPRVGSILRQKAEQAVHAGASWLRVDVMDGLWQFSPWARSSLPAKVSALAAATRRELSAVEGLAGAVISSGACQAQGIFREESCRGAKGEVGLRRLIPPMRVRETVVVPLCADDQPSAEMWIELYDSEPDWLDWALSENDLGKRSDIFALTA
jgi:hypothetical protein